MMSLKNDDVTVDATPVQSAPAEKEEVAQEEIASGAELAQSEWIFMNGIGQQFPTEPLAPD